MTKVLSRVHMIHVWDASAQLSPSDICLPVGWKDRVMVSIQVRNQVVLEHQKGVMCRSEGAYLEIQ